MAKSYFNILGFVSHETFFLQKIPYNLVIHLLVEQMQYVANEMELDHVHVWKDIKEILMMVAVPNAF